jgi:CheY-like chemotaxis protein
MAQPRLNLKNVVAILADTDTFTRGLIAQMLRGFGIENILLASSGAEARAILTENTVDICFFEGAFTDMATADLIGWMRRQTNSPLRFVPVIVLSGYTQLRMISAARDGGAHIVVRKPVSPQALFDRILWVANVARPFLDAGSYVGPDRRFHSALPPDGKMKRQTDAHVAQEA